MSSRSEVVANESLRGIALCHALSDATDEWLTQLFREATAGVKKADDIVLIAVGGYGRKELAPQSDLDVLLVHRGVKDIGDIASRMWYPVWDAGVKLGHSVRTPKETIQLCASDLDTATSLVTARVIAGNTALGEEVISATSESWKKRGREWLVELHARVLDRYDKDGEVAFLLEPNLKEGMGGLRDIHALHWAVRAGLDLLPGDSGQLERCNDVLLNVRVALHRHIGRPTEVLRLEDQRAVAQLAGFESDDALMASVAEVGRRVAWIADEVWARLDPPADRSPIPQPLAPGVQLMNGEVHLTADVDVADDPTLLLRVATAAARLGARIDRASLDRLAQQLPIWPDPWPAGASDDVVALLL
jgi:[protein-PII] uridylyltransferase